MCGICGIISNERVDPGIVSKMNRAMSHRGPDGEGELNEDGISLAMRRLSIIDLHGGWQPLFNEDHSLVLFINGEIYNYIELREQLINKGHKLSTSTDGETILHLYEEHGSNCLKYLRGMFAFALWDKNKKQIFLVRDRMGEKPLYIYQTNKILLFSSELRSLMASEKIAFDLDPAAIDMFFHYHYVPEPNTPIRGIRKLPAGHYLLIDQKSMKVTEHCYWRLEDAPPLTGNPSEMTREKLDEIAKIIIRADVPVGVALSGGIDSSAIAALAVRHYPESMHAFTIGYEGRPESDERHTAKKIAQYLNMPFHEIELSDEDFLNKFPEICSLSDDPIADISAFGYYSISKAAKEMGVPVLLQGQGGDELFWGYPWVRENYKYALLKKNLLNAKSGFFDYFFLKFHERCTKPTLRKVAKGILGYNEAWELFQKHKKENSNIFPFYDYHKGFNWSDQSVNMIYGAKMSESLPHLNAKGPFTLTDGWHNPEITLTRLICNTYLSENGIAQGDRLSMANSVELRLPFVDYQLVETIIGLRKNISDINLPPKEWLNNSIGNILPSWLFKLRKRGFEPPVQKWVNLLVHKYGSILPEGILVEKGILSKDFAVQLKNGRSDPKVTFPMHFNALVLENWIQSFN